jgi:phosphoribosylcarboxyaminoimidazole (NCAIR) mutase
LIFSPLNKKPEVVTMSEPLVGIVMGSDSDLDAMNGAAEMLEKFGVPYEMTVASAHRSPERASKYSRTAKERGLKVIIAGAGWAAHLAGVLAAETMALGKGGARNAAVLAAQILALSDDSLAARLADFKDELARGVEERAAKVDKKFPG